MNILLVDDHAMFRESMMTMLSQSNPEYKIWQTENGKLTLEFLEKQKMDLILLDLGLPDIFGTTLLKKILELHSIPILILTASDDLHDMQQCVDLGAYGYICKTAPSAQVQKAICDVLDGKLLLPDIFHQGGKKLQMDMETISKITPRQKEILKLLHDGNRNKEIARKLNISEATIKVHTRTLFRTLSVNNRHSAVQEALRLRLLKSNVHNS